jgi:hypothetical protein
LRAQSASGLAALARHGVLLQMRAAQQIRAAEAGHERLWLYEDTDA